MKLMNRIIRRLAYAILDCNPVRSYLDRELVAKKTQGAAPANKSPQSEHQHQAPQGPGTQQPYQGHAALVDCQKVQRCRRSKEAASGQQVVKHRTQPVVKRIAQPSPKLITNFAHHKEPAMVSPVTTKGPATLIRSASLLLGEEKQEDEEEVEEVVDWSRGCDIDVAPPLIVPKSSPQFKDSAFIAQSPLFSHLLTIQEKQHKWIPDLRFSEWKEPSKQEFEVIFPKAGIYEDDLIFDTMTFIDPPPFQKFTLKPKRNAPNILKPFADNM